MEITDRSLGPRIFHSLLTCIKLSCLGIMYNNESSSIGTMMVIPFARPLVFHEGVAYAQA